MKELIQIQFWFIVLNQFELCNQWNDVLAFSLRLYLKDFWRKTRIMQPFLWVFPQCMLSWSSIMMKHMEVHHRKQKMPLGNIFKSWGMCLCAFINFNLDPHKSAGLLGPSQWCSVIQYLSALGHRTRPWLVGMVFHEGMIIALKLFRTHHH